MADRVLVRNTCAWSKVDRPYRPICVAAVEAYQLIFTKDLLTVRLLGSVARGEASPEASDIDFLVLVQRAPRSAELEALAQYETTLRTTYPNCGSRGSRSGVLADTVRVSSAGPVE